MIEVAGAPRARFGKVVVTSTLERLEEIANAIERRFAFWPFLVFFPVYFSIAVMEAKRKLMWDDEFFTLYISRANGMKGMLYVLMTGADQHPPLFYYLTHQVMRLLGTSHLTLRLLPMLGFCLMCVCLFYLLYPRTSVLWGFLGMLLPLASKAFYYATEARGYGLMVGFCSLALLSWQRAASVTRKRPQWLFTLFIASGMAVSSHYYSVLFLFALGLGEFARTIQLKRVDFPIWLSFLGGAVPLVVFREIIRSASEYSSHFWATPIWGSLTTYYVQFLGSLSNILILGAIPYLIALLHSDLYEENYRSEICRFATYEVVAWTSITAIPFFTMVLAKTMTHGYTERYALPAIIGVVVLLCHFGYAAAPRPRSFALILSSASLLYFVVHGLGMIRIQPVYVRELGNQMRVLDSHTSPLVLADSMFFHRASFYAPRQIVSNVAYVADPQASLEYIRHDTIDRGLLALRPWFPLNVVPRQTFVEEHREFFVFSYIGSWNWLTYVLVPPRYESTLLNRVDDDDVLLGVHRKSEDPADPEAVSPKPENAKMLFDKISKDGPSLCKQWMPKDSLCDTIEQRRQEALLKSSSEARIR